MCYTVYILYSLSGNTIYIGYTSNLIQRFYSHNIYGHDWTRRFRPWIVIYTEWSESKSEALCREKQLKSGKGREWIWSKINSQFNISGF
ncbi:MAG TPA: GIY-YIG nuclease family protein [Chitinophagaceae bacterium]|jgi:putative endonuclease|nr:GIY-YIG nuclease family protein [Chitinophagaceae bacterium]